MMASRSVPDPNVTFAQKLAQFPYRGGAKYRMDNRRYAALFETHIEQGPILEDAGKDVGIVTAVLGQMLYRSRFHGTAAYAGTLPIVSPNSPRMTLAPRQPL